MPNEPSNHPPASVRRAVLCIWISIALVVLLSVGSVLGVADIPSNVATLVTSVLTACLLALVAVKVSAGKGWARWLYAALFVFGSAGFVALALLVPEVFNVLPMALKASGFVQFALQGAAFALMFTQASRQWFGANKVPSAP